MSQLFERLLGGHVNGFGFRVWGLEFMSPLFERLRGGHVKV